MNRREVETIDPTRGHGEIVFENAPATLLGKEGDGWDNYRRIEAGAAVLVAFEQVGGAEAAMNMAKEYALERYAFGRQIGSYQAIKHKIADMYVKLELARSNAYYGAMALPKMPEIWNWRQPRRAFRPRKPIVLRRRKTFRCMAASVYLGGQYAVPLSPFEIAGAVAGQASRWKDRLVSELEKSNVA